MANEKPTGRTTRTANPTSADTSPDEPAADTSPDEPANDRVAELEAENAELKERLAAAGAPVDGPRKPHEPSFGISEGTREELERTGKATSPFTGRKLTKADLPTK